MDSQMVELVGRNWLVTELLRAGLEVARPERDRGIDLIVYSDLDHQVGDFIACPIQLKAHSDRSFSVHKKYEKFRRLLLVHVWDLDRSSDTRAYALTYAESVGVAEAMEWTKTDSWKTGGRTGKPGYTTNRPSQELIRMLEPYLMTTEAWRAKINTIARMSISGAAF
jgi:hypothetical protein